MTKTNDTVASEQLEMQLTRAIRVSREMEAMRPVNDLVSKLWACIRKNGDNLHVLTKNNTPEQIKIVSNVSTGAPLVEITPHYSMGAVTLKGVWVTGVGSQQFALMATDPWEVCRWLILNLAKDFDLTPAISKAAEDAVRATSKKLTEEQKLILLANRYGISEVKETPTGLWGIRRMEPHDYDTPTKVPDFFGDLNACQRFEDYAWDELSQAGYYQTLRDVCFRKWPLNRDSVRATSEERAEALGFALKLWTAES